MFLWWRNKKKCKIHFFKKKYFAVRYKKTRDKRICLPCAVGKRTGCCRKMHGKRLVCFPTAHGKEIVFVVRLVLAHDKDNAQPNGCERG
jgi:hypothetical protein